METRTKKWQWYRDSIKAEADCVKAILEFEKTEVDLDELFGNPIEQLEQIMKEVNNANNW